MEARTTKDFVPINNITPQKYGDEKGYNRYLHVAI